MSTLAFIFFDVSMSNGHAGLTALLKNKKLEEGETAIFINKKWGALKLLTANDVVLHLKPKHGVSPGAVKFLPNCIEGKTLNYTKALESSMKERFKKARPNFGEEET